MHDNKRTGYDKTLRNPRPRTLKRKNRYAPVPETIVLQPSRLRVPGQVTDLPPHRGVVGLARCQALQFLDHYPALARFEKGAKPAVLLRSVVLGQTQCP